MLRRFWNDEAGQGLIEYVLIIALIAIAVIGLLATIGNNMKDKLSDIADCLDSPAGGECESGAAGATPD